MEGREGLAFHAEINESVKVIQKIQEYMGNSSDVVNKARLFDNNLTKIGPVSGAKVVAILMNYAFKIEKILEEMRSL